MVTAIQIDHAIRYFDSARITVFLISDLALVEPSDLVAEHLVCNKSLSPACSYPMNVPDILRARAIVKVCNHGREVCPARLDDSCVGRVIVSD